MDDDWGTPILGTPQMLFICEDTRGILGMIMDYDGLSECMKWRILIHQP